MSLLAMSLQRDTLRRAGLHLGIAAGLVLLGAAALLLARWDRDTQRQRLGEAQSQLSALQDEGAQLEESLHMLEGNIDRFRTLQRGGFIGAGDRIAWTEALLRVQQRLGLPAIAFELAPQEMLEPPAIDPSLMGIDTPQPPPAGPLAHDLRIQMEGIHEGELLALIEALDSEQVGHFRPQGCRLVRDPQAVGLSLDCTVRWITYLPPSAPAEAGTDDEALE